MSPAKCDFCAASAPSWFFPCRDFHYAGRDFVSGWLACGDCYVDLIENRRTSLVRRALRRYRPIVRSLLESDTELLFAQFDKHRVGEPVAV